MKDYGTPAKVLAPLAKDPTGAAYRGDVQMIDGKEVWVPNPKGGIFSPDAPKPNPEDKGGLFGWGAHPAQPQELNGNEIMITWPQAQQSGHRYQNLMKRVGGGAAGT